MDFAEQLKTSIDIVKVVGEYVRLRRVGATGRYIGLCPFHQEKTPSFNVNQTRQFFKCFGCGVGGDAYKFVMDIEGFTFPEVLKLLAERNGVPMPQRNEYSDASSKLRGALMEMHAIAVRQFQADLRGQEGTEARAYLAHRGVSPEQIEVFELGYATSDWQTLVRKFSEGFSSEQLDASGLVRKRNEGNGYYDVFRERLMFPIHNESGKVIAFGGRTMKSDEPAKYLNSSETPIYKKTSVVYNLHRARQSMRDNNRAVLVEGYMDVIGVHAAGVKEVIASCGTALTIQQVQTIHRHASTVVLNFDGDTAGSSASEKAIPLLLDVGLHARVLTLDGGLDPDEYVKQSGAEAYRNKLEHAGTYFHWLADHTRKKFDMGTSEGRKAAFDSLLKVVQNVPDKLERAAVANDLAGYLGVDQGLILEEFKKAAADRRVASPRAVERPSIPANERILLNALLSSAIAREEILPKLTPALTQSFVTHEIFDNLRAAVADNPDFSFSALEGRLSPRSQTLLHEALSADDTEDEAVPLAQAEACVRRFEGDFHKKQVDDLRAQIKLAEREGRVEEALSLMEQLNSLERKARSVGK